MTPPKPPRGRGRPRGSGRQCVIPAVELTQVEAVPFAAGQRNRPVLKTLDHARVPSVRDLAHLLTRDELDAAMRSNERWFVAWFAVGAMQAGIEKAIEIARSV